MRASCGASRVRRLSAVDRLGTDMQLPQNRGLVLVVVGVLVLANVSLVLHYVQGGSVPQQPGASQQRAAGAVRGVSADALASLTSIVANAEEEEGDSEGDADADEDSSAVAAPAAAEQRAGTKASAPTSQPREVAAARQQALFSRPILPRFPVLLKVRALGFWGMLKHGYF